jgi:hypothetical protein
MDQRAAARRTVLRLDLAEWDRPGGVDLPCVTILGDRIRVSFLAEAGAIHQ